MRLNAPVFGLRLACRYLIERVLTGDPESMKGSADELRASVWPASGYGWKAVNSASMPSSSSDVGLLSRELTATTVTLVDQ